MDSVVKIDTEILKEIEKFLENNKYKYSSKKQVVNLALIDFLKSNGFKFNEIKRGKNKRGR